MLRTLSKIFLTVLVDQSQGEDFLKGMNDD